MEVSSQKSAYDFDFDLNLLAPSTDTSEKTHTKKNPISTFKEKITTVNSLIQLANVREDLLHQTQKQLIAANEDHKETHIKYKLELQKCQSLEKEAQLLRLKSQELLDNTLTLENQKAAEKSYINQLESLVKERDTFVKSLKSQAQFHQDKVRRMDKRVKKERKILLRSLTGIADMIFRKKPLSKRDKVFLVKYINRHKNGSKENYVEEISSTSLEHSFNEFTPEKDDTTDIESFSDNFSEIDIINDAAESPEIHKDTTDQDIDTFSEPPVSVDTGRGSSLALSHVEKGFSSPEYSLTDSPASVDIFKKKKMVDQSTSPITVIKTMDRAASPIILTSSVNKQNIDRSTSPIGMTLVDIVTSPIMMKRTVEMATSPITLEQILVPLNNRKIEKSSIISQQNTPMIVATRMSTREAVVEDNEETLASSSNAATDLEKCLESNNNNSCDDNEIDAEIEMIFSNMRFHHDLITPIPCTPANSVVKKLDLKKKHNSEVSSTSPNAQAEIHLDEVIKEKDCNSVQSPYNNKPKKLTRLQKMRNSLLPKGKIRKEEINIKSKLRNNVKSIVLNKTSTKCESEGSLNNKDVYEKAVKVMADIKMKQKIKEATQNLKSVRRSAMKINSAVLNGKDAKSEDNSNTSQNIINLDDKSTAEKHHPNNILYNKELCVVLSPDNLEEKMVELTTESKGNRKIKKHLDSKSLSEKSQSPSTRVLRSSIAQNSTIQNKVVELNNNENEVIPQDIIIEATEVVNKPNAKTCISSKTESHNTLINYQDIDLFDDEPTPKKVKNDEDNITVTEQNLQDGMLCKMIEKYGVPNIKWHPKKIAETVINSIHKKIEDGIKNINELPTAETKLAMDTLSQELQKWKVKEVLPALIQYLKDPERKIELFNKTNTPPAPPMTKQEQILLYLIMKLKVSWPEVDFVDCMLNQIEFTLFKLNSAPVFEVIEVMSHFYAVVCRYINAKSRLRIFLLDAMYCIQFKAVPLIKQCMEVWMHILPLAHMGSAKCPLVTCLVYLLHFYKCEDKFNRVEEIRIMLRQKYYFQPTEWNETKILEMFKNAIISVRDIPVEKKMLKLALILLAKRHGPQWCQKKIIQNIIIPVLGKKDIPERTRVFCISMFGPLMKPYPMDMKVHCEIIIGQLIDMLDQNPSPKVQEAIFSSLMAMSKHNFNRVVYALLPWQPKHRISIEFENNLRDFVKERPIKMWKKVLTKVSEEL